MNAKGFLLASIVLITLAVGSVFAQANLGDMVAQGGYDWLIGKWTATTDDGDKFYFEHKWGLDRNVIFVDFRTPDFDYRGMIAYVPFREEVVQSGVDNQGGTYKGLWRQEYESAVLMMEHTKANGTVDKMELVYKRGQDKTIEIDVYGVESDGWRASEPMAELKFKPLTSDIPAKGSSSRGYSYYQSLGDLASQMGYEWIAGKWTAERQDGPVVELKYDWILDKYAVTVDVQIGSFKYSGFIMFIPSREEVVQIGADNMGGIWDGIWSESYDGVAHRTQCTRPDGTKIRVEHVYAPDGKDTFTLKEYRVDADGYRGNSPTNTQTYKRVPTKTAK